MALAVVVASVQALGINGGTTSGIDTSGATGLVVGIVYQQGSTPTLSDSKGNTWTGLTAQTAGGDCFTQLYYATNPTVGTGHTFTVAGTNVASSIGILALSGANTSTFYDGTENGAGSINAIAIQPGSITPSQNDCVAVTVMSNYIDTGAASRSIDSGYTLHGQVGFSAGNYFPLACASLIQTTASATNPTWSWAGSQRVNTSIAAFRSSGGGGGSSSPWYLYRQLAS